MLKNPVLGENTSGLLGGWGEGENNMNYELHKATCAYGLGPILKSCNWRVSTTERENAVLENAFAGLAA